MEKSPVAPIRVQVTFEVELVPGDPHLKLPSQVRDSVLTRAREHGVRPKGVRRPAVPGITFHKRDSQSHEELMMAKALFGHVGAAPDRRLIDEVTRLRSRVQALEFEVTRLRAENDRLAAAAAEADDFARLTEPALT
jgi:hypothetical protein